MSNSNSSSLDVDLGEDGGCVSLLLGDNVNPDVELALATYDVVADDSEDWLATVTAAGWKAVDDSARAVDSAKACGALVAGSNIAGRDNSTFFRFRWLALSLLVPGACVSLHSAVAQNSPADRSFDKRVYIGGSLGISRIQPDAFCPCLTISDENDLARTLFVGVDISKRFSIEGYYSDLGASSVDFLGSEVGDISYSVGGINGVFYIKNFGTDSSAYADGGYYLREGLSIYAKLGIGAMQNDSSLDYTREHTAHLSAGLGLEYGFANGFALRGEVTSFDTDAQQITASLLKRFGRADVYEPSTLVAPNVAAPIAKLPEKKTSPEPVGAPLELPTVYFEFGQYRLTSAAKQTLNQFSDLVGSQPNLEIKLSGHTDEVDTEQFNMRLSENRAKAIKSYLVQRGLTESRIATEGFGELYPVASNNTAEGRALNRRVEFALNFSR